MWRIRDVALIHGDGEKVAPLDTEFDVYKFGGVVNEAIPRSVMEFEIPIIIVSLAIYCLVSFSFVPLN